MKLKYLMVGSFVGLVAMAPDLISRLASPDVVDSTHVTPRAVQENDRTAGIALAKRGNELQDKQQYAEAARAYDQAAEKIPQVRDWLSIFAAASISHLGDTTEVARRLQSTDSALLQEWTWRLRARAYGRAGNNSRALDIARDATQRGTAAKRAAAWLAVAELRRDMADRSGQRTALVRAMEVAAVAEGALDAARVLVQFEDLTLSERLLAGRTLMRNGEPRLGLRQLITFAEKTSDADLRNDVRYEAGRAAFAVGDYKVAERELLRIGARHPRRADARFFAARAQYRLGKEREGVATLRSVVAQHPKSVVATRALYLLGDLAQDDGRVTNAITYFKQAAARHALGGDEPAQALMRLGAIHYARKNFAAAESTFATYRTRYPKGAAYEQATYWAAQARAAAGKQAQARELLQKLAERGSLSYYDVRASQILDKDVLPTFLAGPLIDIPELPRINAALDRWLLLRDIGWNDAAAFELSRLRNDVAGNTAALYAVAEGLNAREQSHFAIAIGRELLNAGTPWDARLLRIMFPLPYLGIIKREARTRGLDPFFVAALMRQESRFNARAVSSAGAIGLMQVMPRTGQQLGGVTREGLMDPATNIRLGTQFLADLMNMYDKRDDAVLAAYNAGPGRMNRWRSFPEFATPDLFIERIPFDETRDYVKVVRVNTSIYRALYGD
jgi:soluble lytic murein transglycosylase-like protein